MGTTFRVLFDGGKAADAVRVRDASEVQATLQQLNLTVPSSTLVIVGGASGLSADYISRLQELFVSTICPIAESRHLCVVDGGTDVGVMQLVGRARAKTESTFPLVGVVVEAKAILPRRRPPSEDAAALEPNHTHFLLVPGHEWGDEAPWIARVAGSLAEGMPSATLLINGGNIALNRDVPNSVHAQRPVLVVAGSGRAADKLAAAVRDRASFPDIQDMARSGLIQVIDLEEGSDVLGRSLCQMLGEPVGERP